MDRWLGLWEKEKFEKLVLVVEMLARVNEEIERKLDEIIKCDESLDRWIADELIAQAKQLFNSLVRE